jgi:hypothetical protein
MCIGILLFLSSSVYASIGESDVVSDRLRNQAGRPIPVGQALEILAQELKAHVIVMGLKPTLNLVTDQIVLDLDNRSAMDNLKSILKGYSYAILFNIPPYSYSAIVETASDGYRLVSNPAPIWLTTGEEQSHSDHLGSVEVALATFREPVNRDDRLYQKRENKNSSRELSSHSEATESTAFAGRKSELIEKLNQIRQEIDGTDGQGSLGGIEQQIDQLQEGISSMDDQAFSDDTWEALLAQIDFLRSQIESGEADLFYEKWSQARGKYALDPYEELHRLEEKMDNLNE